ncbi:hypothetical protein IVB40_32560 [Bradyrhizobium sp. 40]|uniref:ArnT family glycosyltransferase n=1 Tax=Bradyrhizobium sp. 40 TaxID=2782674 RepID=UPI001FFE914F|nr:hypothetical protein [Bradyrhizobium sp. 40]UPJ41958.1 hypothetical protein IVB40_32560 [Bradyrhizobium sp. 40]
MRSSYVIVGVLIACFVAAVAIHSSATTLASSDEATSIFASRQITATGLPRVPSQQIYFRSLIPHYLTAASIALFGDNPLGWRGASIAAYGLLLLLPALMLRERGPSWLSPLWVLAVGTLPTMLKAAESARMYMIYILFVSLAVCQAVLWRPLRWNGAGWLYLLTCILAASSHEHFVVFVPGLLCAAGLSLYPLDPLCRRAALMSPMVVAPLAGFLSAVFWHLSEPYIPNVFMNVTGGVRLFAGNPSVTYPLEVLADSPLPMLLVLIATVAYVWRQGKSVAHSLAIPATVIFAVTFASVCVTMPANYDYYVSPLWPALVLAICATAVNDQQTSGSSSGYARSAAAALLMLFTAVVGSSPSSAIHSAQRVYALGVKRPPPEWRKWSALRSFALTADALIITSNPEILQLNHIEPIVAHVRHYKVSAASPCDVVMDDYLPVPFAHHTCQMDQLIATADGDKKPILFIGNRLGDTIGAENTSYIRTRFKRVGAVDDQEVYCYGRGCDTLAI